MLNYKKISIIIPTFNRAVTLKNNLSTFINQNYPKNNFEIIIVDDGSTDNTQEIITNLIKEKRQIDIKYYYKKNEGPAKARNFGIKQAVGEIIAFSDDDCRPDENWIKEMNSSFSKDEIVGVGGKIISLKKEATAFTHQIDCDYADSFPSGNVAYLKTALKKVGGFDESLRFSNEDNELAIAISKVGKLAHNSKMIVYDPPRRMGLGDIKGVIYLESVFHVVKKHPDIYHGFRRNPWVDIYWNWFVKHFFRQAKKGIEFFWKNPFDFFKLLLLVIAQRVYLILLIPYFWKASRRYT